MTNTNPHEDRADLTKHAWTYAGRRVGSSKVVHHWVDHNGKEHRYDHVPTGAVIGGSYEVLCNEAGTTAVIRGAEYLHPAEVEAAERDAWKLADRAASAWQEQRRAEARAAKDNGSLGDLTLADVRKALLRQPFHLRAGTLAAVLAYLGVA